VIVCGLMCWYDESPADLTRAVKSAAAAGMSRLVALDGRYAQYPAEETLSPLDQLEAIEAAAEGAGVAFDYVDTVIPWLSEMHKRSFMFKVGDDFCSDLDESEVWYLILDADYEIRSLRPIPELLAGRSGRAAEAKMILPYSRKLLASTLPQVSRTRPLFRGRGIRVEGNHYTYIHGEETILWAGPARDQVAAIDLAEEMTVYHYTFQRSEKRYADQVAYYHERDEQGIERGPCDVCGRERSICFLPLARTGRALGEGRYDFDYAEVCRDCIPVVSKENNGHALRLGIDPAAVNTPLNLVRGVL
jgi:hypothetical protein